MGAAALAGIGGIAYAMMPKKYTFGNDLTVNPHEGNVTSGGAGDTTYKSPVTGKLTKWRIKFSRAYSDSSQTTPVNPIIRFYVFREASGGYHCVGRDVRTATTGINEFDVDIAVNKGDFLFINVGEQYVYCNSPIPFGEYFCLYDNSYRDYSVCSTYSFGTQSQRPLLINADVIGR